LQAIAASNTGSKALPSPTSTPVVIALGLGTQNYTCNSTGHWIQTGPNTGAKATLFNATSYLSEHPDEVATLPSERLAKYEQTGGCVDETSVRPTLAVLGEHYFNGAGIPTFDLFDAVPSRLFLNAAKDGDVKAPNSTADIDWLYLEYVNGTGSAIGITSVYRVETAGGVAPSSCTSAENGTETSVMYSAEYWFYD